MQINEYQAYVKQVMEWKKKFASNETLQSYVHSMVKGAGDGMADSQEGRGFFYPDI